MKHRDRYGITTENKVGVPPDRKRCACSVGSYILGTMRQCKNKIQHANRCMMHNKMNERIRISKRDLIRQRRKGL